jgi:hypothetical protein
MGIQFKNIHLRQLTAVSVFYLCSQEFVSVVRRAKQASSGFSRSIAKENCQPFTTYAAPDAPKVDLAQISWKFLCDLSYNRTDTVAAGVP